MYEYIEPWQEDSEAHDAELARDQLGQQIRPAVAALRALVERGAAPDDAERVAATIALGQAITAYQRAADDAARARDIAVGYRAGAAIEVLTEAREAGVTA